MFIAHISGTKQLLKLSNFELCLSSILKEPVVMQMD